MSETPPNQPALITGIPSIEEVQRLYGDGGAALQPVVDPTLAQGSTISLRTTEEVDKTFSNLPKPYILESMDRHIADTIRNVSDPIVAQRSVNILETGMDEGQDVVHADLVAHNAGDEFAIRERLASLVSDAPDTYEAIKQGKVAGFHGTRSSALAGMLKRGKLMSARLINEPSNGGDSNKPHMVTGEHGTQAVEGQDSISFSHLGAVESAGAYAGAEVVQKRSHEEAVSNLLERARIGRSGAGQVGNRSARHAIAQAERLEKMAGFMQANPQSLESALQRADFPVLLGVSADFLTQAENKPDPRIAHKVTQTGSSEMGEFRPMAAEIPLEALPVVAVPRDFMKGTQELFTMFKYDAQVVPLEDIYRGSSSNRQGTYYGSYRQH